MNDIERLAAMASRLIRNERVGILCTLSKNISGWPFGSLAPYALLPSGEPVLLISGLAEHTHNLLADPRMSLFIRDSSATADPQAGARATLVGFALPVVREGHDQARRAYLERFPEAESYFRAHDFSFYRVKTEHIRFIGGFGVIGWLSPEDVFKQGARGGRR